MNTEQRLKTFNKENAPFYIVDHEDGEFSLCLAFSFLSGDYADYGQAAFNHYAEQIGDPVIERDLYTHGNGYEWESVFKKAFENDANIDKISFDCEAGGFFCYTDDLTLLEDFGKRFRAICVDTDRFSELVCTALTEAAIREAEDEKIRGTVRGFLVECPDAEAEIVTPDGRLTLTAEQGQQLLNGSMESIAIGGVEVDADALLSQKITHIYQDVLGDGRFRMKTETPEETLAPEISM